MKRVVNIAKDKNEADKWDIRQATRMSVEERQKVARTLKKRVYGNTPDIKEWRKLNR
ncbi:hypothetical protein ACG2F4_17885 [Halalkalibaculum sp. DA3122]|uniref:hypothetical protein n=1 Tax=unclassified Halalkalibaculum TaxID=2964617 RepID=UPI003754BA17